MLAVRTVQTSVSGIFAPLFDVVAAPVRAVETMFEGMRTVASLREETVRLRAENERLKRWQRRSEILESENRQLRTVLGAVIPADRQAVTARAIAAPGSSFSHTMMITHGRDKRIHRGDPVVTADGLVGYIIEVGKRHSWVLMLSDVNSRIPILLSTSSWPGLAIGQNSDMLSLSFLPLEAEPKENELVLTSGHGEILPPGLPVGRVVSGGGRDFYIQPVVDLRKVAFVSILVRPEGDDRQDIDGFADFFTPLPENDDKRLLEGFSPKDVLQ
ncbi:MAG: rod shape-determining protein MreC [Candidatus Puniceispirillaceae bacterium]